MQCSANTHLTKYLCTKTLHSWTAFELLKRVVISCTDGEHLGTLNDTVEDLDPQDAFSGRSYASVSNTNDINSKTGLDIGRLNGLFERPTAELVSDLAWPIMVTHVADALHWPCSGNAWKLVVGQAAGQVEGITGLCI